MPITSLDHLMFRTTNGYIYSYDWSHTNNVALVANRFFDMSTTALPSPNLYPATNGALTWVDCNSSSSFSLPSGPSIQSAYQSKHIFFASAGSASTGGVPGYFLLVDLQGYWPISTTTASLQSLSGTPTLRYTNGEGLKLYTVATVATGSGAQNITSISYTNQAGTPGRNLSQTVAMVVSSVVGSVIHSGAGAGAIHANPFLPLAGGDTGVQNVASIQLSAAQATGTAALCLAKPILTVPLALGANITERDFVNQFPSLPEIKNDACLVWLFYAGVSTAINTNYFGSLEFVWG